MQVASPFSTPLAPPLHRLEVEEVSGVQGQDRPVVVLNRVAVGVAILPQSGELEILFSNGNVSLETFDEYLLVHHA